MKPEIIKHFLNEVEHFLSIDIVYGYNNIQKEPQKPMNFVL